MYFPKFLVGMAATLLVAVGWIYVKTGSLGVSLGWAALAALLLQAGYFIGILAMIFVPRISRMHRLFSPKDSPENSIADGEAFRAKARRDYLPIAPKGPVTPDPEH